MTPRRYADNLGERVLDLGFVPLDNMGAVRSESKLARHHRTSLTGWRGGPGVTFFPRRVSS